MSVPIRIFPFVLISALSLAVAQDVPPEKNQEAPAATPINKQILQHIDSLAASERDKRMDLMLVVIDDITRLCELNDEQKDQLILSAKEATKGTMKQWQEQAERYFRARISGADPDTAKEILAKIGTISFENKKPDPQTEMQSIWKDSLKNVLSEAQIKRYEDVITERKRAEVDAFSEMAISSLDHFLRLTPDQKSKLSLIVHQSAIENLDEVRRYWGDYLEKNMLMSLVNIADKKTLTGILSTNQYERLQTATSNLNHFWENRRKQKKDGKLSGKKDEFEIDLQQAPVPVDRLGNISVNF